MAISRIEADVLIPGRGDPIPDGCVVMSLGTIAYAGPAASAPVDDAAATVRVPAVMPGMWDCHGHFTGLRRPDIEGLLTLPQAVAAARGYQDARKVLDAGFTSIREPGGIGIFLARVIDEGAAVGPSIYSAARVLSQTGGHGDVHGFPVEIVSHNDMFELCDGVPDCLRAVRMQLRNGAALIKICASGGVMSEVDHPIHQQFSDEELRAIVDEAARSERVVAAHCHGKPGIMAALEAGAHTIEHGTYLDDEAADVMLEQGAILVPTRLIVEELLGMKDELPAYAFEKIVMISDTHKQALQLAISKGVRIAVGSDIFVTGRQWGTNGRELKHLVDAGMTPLAAIEAATATSVQTLGPRAPRSGVLAEGYDADVIAVAGNPLDEILLLADPSNITHVWKGGELVKEPLAAHRG